MAIATPEVGSTGWDVQMDAVIARVNELENIDATTDADKPVSTAQAAALALKAPLASPAFTGTPTGITKTHVGLGSVDNTADTAKPVSTAQQTALNLKANLAGPTFTGTVTVPRLIAPPVTLTDAATIAVDASLGNHFRVTLGGNRTLGAPTNPTDGQKILIEVIQDGTGTRTLGYNAVYGFGTDVTSPTLTTTAAQRDFLGFVYNSTAVKWYALGVSKGY